MLRQKNVINSNHHYFSKSIKGVFQHSSHLHRGTPPICIEICLGFVGEGVMQGNSCPRGCSWRVHCFFATLKFALKTAENLELWKRLVATGPESRSDLSDSKETFSPFIALSTKNSKVTKKRLLEPQKSLLILSHFGGQKVSFWSLLSLFVERGKKGKNLFSVSFESDKLFRDSRPVAASRFHKPRIH